MRINFNIYEAGTLRVDPDDVVLVRPTQIENVTRILLKPTTSVSTEGWDVVGDARGVLEKLETTQIQHAGNDAFDRMNEWIAGNARVRVAGLVAFLQEHGRLPAVGESIVTHGDYV